MKATKTKTSGYKLPGPNDLNEPPEKLLSYCMLIFGEKGIGKTSLCASFPNSVVGMLEPRRRNLRIRMEDLSPGWERVLEFTYAAVEADDVDTICYDTADRLYDSAMAYVCGAKGVDHPNKMNDYGATWKEVKDTFEGLLGIVQNSGKGLVLTSHAKWKEAELRNGEKLQILCPTLSDAPWTIIKAVADFAFYYGYHGNRRALYLRGHEDLWCACGTKEHFCDPNGKPVRTIYLGRQGADSWEEDPELAFQQLDHSFANMVYDLADVDAGKVSVPKKTKAKA